jgi:hypothetical protein
MLRGTKPTLLCGGRCDKTRPCSGAARAPTAGAKKLLGRRELGGGDDHPRGIRQPGEMERWRRVEVRASRGPVDDRAVAADPRWVVTRYRIVSQSTLARQKEVPTGGFLPPGLSFRRGGEQQPKPAAAANPAANTATAGGRVPGKSDFGRRSSLSSACRSASAVHPAAAPKCVRLSRPAAAK